MPRSPCSATGEAAATRSLQAQSEPPLLATAREEPTRQPGPSAAKNKLESLKLTRGSLLRQRKVRNPDSGGSKEESRKTCFSFPFAHVSPHARAVSHCWGLGCIFLTDSRQLGRTCALLYFMFPHLAPYLHRGKHSLCMFLE